MGVVSRAPTRIDLAGGTLDIWPISLLHRGAVTVNLAVTVHANARATPRSDGQFSIVSADRGLEATAASPAAIAAAEPQLVLAARILEHFSSERPMSLHLDAKAPAHAGLGGSSALMIAAAGALDRANEGNRSRTQLLHIVQDLETSVIAVPTGQQDYVAALWGGLQALYWEPGGARRVRLNGKSLSDRLILAYTGAPRFSGANNWEVTKRRIDGDPEIIQRLDRIRDAASDLVAALEAADYDAVAASMNREWQQRRELSPGITTDMIETLEASARNAGATAFKVCGAGGGGCVVAMAEPDDRTAVEDAMTAAGGQLLAFDADEEGLVAQPPGDPPLSERDSK